MNKKELLLLGGGILVVLYLLTKSKSQVVGIRPGFAANPSISGWNSGPNFATMTPNEIVAATSGSARAQGIITAWDNGVGKMCVTDQQGNSTCVPIGTDLTGESADCTDPNSITFPCGGSLTASAPGRGAV